jgi:urea carboxylase-associated protein 2
MREPATSTLDEARAHARSQAGASSAAGRTIPSSAATDLPAGVEPAAVLWDETVAIGGYAANVLPRGSVIRLTDVEGDGCVQLLVLNADQPAERLNVADTVKVQWQAYLGEGALLLSDMGRVLMSIVADTSERHDCLCGCSNRRHNEVRYGDGAIFGQSPNARDLLSLAAAKHGLSRADIGPNINLFKTVRVADDGSLHLEGTPMPNAFIELRAEMNVVVALANTPHPLDDRNGYTGTTVRVTAWRAGLPSDDDSIRHATPERMRAFQNTDEYVAAVGQ